MPRFFFNVHDGKNLMDEVGQELADIAEARRQAVRYAGCLIAEMSDEPAVADDWKMDVCDERGLVLFTFMFFGLDAAAPRSATRSPSKAASLRPLPLLDGRGARDETGDRSVSADWTDREQGRRRTG